MTPADAAATPAHAATPALRVPESAAARGAVEVAREFHTTALVEHCIRSYLFAAELGRTTGLAFDDELLFVAAMLHDLGLADAFDHAETSFELSGGDVARVFAAGAGWPPPRRRRTAEIIDRHMADSVDPAVDPEGYLLCESTGLDISGRGAERWSPAFLDAVLAAHPRGALAEDFLACFESQAARKPHSAPAAALASGLAIRLRANPLGS
ncbi:HD domain-containing protein [Herbiconiux liukaitaii]|uniref:HD domain-containing protein n=1 Tax=Herbiconiux liukaitaii TaxID=3342799 RepID=UPI0035BB22E5